MDAARMAQQAVEESAVLLKNENDLLPLPRGSKAAFFGWAQEDPVISGNGSGAARSQRELNFVSACEQAGIAPVESVLEFYRQWRRETRQDAGSQLDFAQMKELVNSGAMYEIFGTYTPNPTEPSVPRELVEAAARETDTAVWILGRRAGGEECDRRLENDYYLSQEEKELLESLRQCFQNIVVVVNSNGVVDLTWAADCPQVRSLLFLGVPGEAGPVALGRLLTGAATPCGKLAFTLPRQVEDYPSWEDFTWDKDHPETTRTYETYGLLPPEGGDFALRPVTPYREDLYLGYRYFDTFGVEPLYPFGFGLSYTSFSLKPLTGRRVGEGVFLEVEVQNTGIRPGREVVQAYLRAQGTRSPRPLRELKAFGKTRLLAPGQGETVKLFVPWRELACFAEDRSAWVVEAGVYALEVGDCSRSLELAAVIQAEEDILLEQGAPWLLLREDYREKLEFLQGPRREDAIEPGNCPVWRLTFVPAPEKGQPLLLPPLPQGLSQRELACLCVGYGPGVPFSAFLETEAPSSLTEESGKPLTVNDHPVGWAGNTSPAIPEKGIHSLFYKDGPAGVGGVAWPTEMLLACSFDRKLLQSVGQAIGDECLDLGVNVWLAPALNLHRHPLGGRNFEYYSEDPFLSGALAAAVIQGVQEGRPVMCCAKHFAGNEQETFRRGSHKLHCDAVDTLATPRALRELYLRPFEMAVREGGLHCVMTSFNKVNGTFAGGSRDLCTGILREEWGFDGLVVTDWGDMDLVVDGADAVAAGNDVIMPGGPPVAEQILRGLEEGRVTREDLERSVRRLLGLLRRVDRDRL